MKNDKKIVFKDGQVLSAYISHCWMYLNKKTWDNPEEFYHLIEYFIKNYPNHDQPERSKREDECNESGHVWTWMPKDQKACIRCGALNTVVTS